MKKLFVFAALILIIAAGIFAQAFPEQVTASSPAMPGGWASPQFTATQGRFRSDADNFIRPDYYTAMKFDKFYAMASFAFNNRAQLGYAGKIGNLYIAAAYGGKFWANYTDLSYTEGDYAGWPGGTKTVRVYDPFAFDPNAKPENRIAILLGVANMGFRFTFSSDGHELISIKDSVVATIPVNSYKAERGTISPQIAWAMGKDLTENGIRPYVLIDLNFTRDYIKTEVPIVGSFVDHSENSFDPKLTLGLGGYTFYKSSGNFRLLADFEYALKLKLYGNDYSYTDGGNFKTSKIKGKNTGSALSEDTYNGHRITPALAGQWSGGPLGLRFRLNLPIIFEGQKSTDLVDINGNPVSLGTTTSSSYIGFVPNLQLAAQWQIVSKLALNIGGKISFGVSRTTDTTNAPAVSPESRTTVKHETTGNDLTIGFTFLPTDHLTFEASSGVSSINNTSTVISVFNTNSGLLAFSSLLVGLKF